MYICLEIHRLYIIGVFFFLYLYIRKYNIVYYISCINIYIYIIHKCMHIYRIRMNSDGVFHVFPMLTHPIVHPVPNLFSAKNGEN